MSAYERRPTPVEIDPEMVDRIKKYIERYGKAEGLKTIASVVRFATNLFLKEHNL